MKLDHAEFNMFWQHYPRHVAKIAAMKAYVKARKVATAQEILDGVSRYVQHKPAYADWCFPATFLNQGRWADEWDAPVQPPPAAGDWYTECGELHNHACGLDRWQHAQRKKMDGAA